MMGRTSKKEKTAGRKSLATIAVLIVLVCFLGSGCASKYGAQTTHVNYYKECYDPIAELRAAEDNFNKTVAAGVAIGAVGGALIGALTTKDAKGAAIGALAGAAAGGAMGYATAKQSQIKDDQKRLDSYRKDIGADVQGLDRAMAAATVASNCYDRQFKANVEDFKAGKLSKQEFTDRYHEIKSGLSEVSQILGKVSESAKSKEEQYTAALSSEAAKAGRPVPQPAAPQPTAAAQEPPPAQDTAPPAAQPPEPKPVAKKEPVKTQTAAKAPRKAATGQANAPSAGQPDKLADMADDLESYKSKTQSVEESNAQIKDRMSSYQQTVSAVLG